jgi:hypothetical protein
LEAKQPRNIFVGLAVGNRQSRAIGNRQSQSAIGNRQSQSAIGNRQSAIAIGNRNRQSHSPIIIPHSAIVKPMRSARSINTTRSNVTDKRQAILRAAIRVFAHNGYFSSKVADIAREAGVADGTVYLYFKSKEEILHSIFDRSMEEGIAEGRKLLEGISDPREKLRRIAVLHLERLGADRDLAVVFPG